MLIQILVCWQAMVQPQSWLSQWWRLLRMAATINRKVSAGTADTCYRYVTQ